MSKHDDYQPQFISPEDAAAFVIVTAAICVMLAKAVRALIAL